MDILINKQKYRNFKVKGAIYRVPIVISLNQNLPLENGSEEVDITFEDCQFPLGIEVLLDVVNTNFTKVKFHFHDCLIWGKSLVYSITAGDNQEVELSFFGCYVQNLDITSSRFSALMMGRTIVGQRLAVNESVIDSILFQNCLGNYFCNDNGKSRISIVFTDSNLSVDFSKKGMYRFYKRLVGQLHLKNILGLKTKFYINDPLEVWLNFSLNSSKSGLIRSKEPKISGKWETVLRYYPTAADIAELDISFSLNQDSGFTSSAKVEKGMLRSLSLRGSAESTIKLEHLKCGAVYIDNLKAKDLQLYDIQGMTGLEQTPFEIKNTNLGAAHFNKVHFNSFSIVNFYRCFFEEAKFSGVLFPEKIETIENVHRPEMREANYNEMQYELYRQMKVALVKNYNQIQALQMHQRMFNAMVTNEELPKEDRFILLLNWVSNNHETSILRPFALSMGLLTLFWFLFCFYMPNRPFVMGWEGCHAMAEGIKAYFSFVWDNFKVFLVLANPAHSISNLSELISKEAKLTTAGYLISFLSRLFIAWTYYQFISSFRKFGKKL